MRSEVALVGVCAGVVALQLEVELHLFERDQTQQVGYHSRLLLLPGNTCCCSRLLVGLPAAVFLLPCCFGCSLAGCESEMGPERLLLSCVRCVVGDECEWSAIILQPHEKERERERDENLRSTHTDNTLTHTLRSTSCCAAAQQLVGQCRLLSRASRRRHSASCNLCARNCSRTLPEATGGSQLDLRDARGATRAAPNTFAVWASRLPRLQLDLASGRLYLAST